MSKDGWSVNHLAARAVAMYGSPEPHVPDEPGCPHCAEAIGWMEALGILVPDDRRIVPDDTRLIEVVPVGDTSFEPRSGLAIREPHMDRSAVPPGLANLPPLEEPPPRRRRKAAQVTTEEDVVTRRRARTASCGTLGGRGVHTRRGEKMCRACMDAQNAYHRKLRKEKRLGSRRAKQSEQSA